VTLRSGIANLFFKEGRQLTRAEVEAFRKATDRPLEFSLAGRSQVTIDLALVAEAERLPHLRGVLGKIS